MFSLYHGTTYEGAQDILKNGYNYFKGMQAWNCSNPNHIYFYNPLKMLEYEMGLDVENVDANDWDDARNRCLMLAKESGDIQNALNPNPNNQVCVLEFVFDAENEIEMLGELGEDYSCENMETASVLPVEFINDCIKNKKVGIVIHYFKFIVTLTPFYLIGIFNNQYATQAMEKLEPEMYDTISILLDTDYYNICESITDNTSETVDKTYYNF